MKFPARKCVSDSVNMTRYMEYSQLDRVVDVEQEMVDGGFQDFVVGREC